LIVPKDGILLALGRAVCDVKYSSYKPNLFMISARLGFFLVRKSRGKSEREDERRLAADYGLIDVVS